jgi:hypothetical protein
LKDKTKQREVKKMIIKKIWKGNGVEEIRELNFDDVRRLAGCYKNICSKTDILKVEELLSEGITLQTLCAFYKKDGDKNEPKEK